MKKKKNRIKKLLTIIAIFLMNGLGFMNAVYATSTNSINLYVTEDCGQLLKYQGVTVENSYIQYNNNGISYPAYCMTPNELEEQNHSVSIQEKVNDVALWRIIINGYPYKTIEELGVANKKEAFTATKQAIYCYIYGNKIEDYESIGEAGERTLRAMKNIIDNANYSNETPSSSNIHINQKTSQWAQDNIDKQYISKTYNVTANAEIKNYKITMRTENGENIEGVKITNNQNEEKSEFAANEEFKILVPIKNMIETVTFKLIVERSSRNKTSSIWCITNSFRKWMCFNNNNL